MIVNDENTKEFQVCRGTIQGCPLSPLLFIFDLEVLLRRVQASKEIPGLKNTKNEYKYRAYVDYVLFITENPTKMVPKLLNKIKNFGELVGFYLNYKNTKILCKNMTNKEETESQNLMKCEVVNKVKYLGIFITKTNIDLFKNNFERTSEEIIKKLQIWNKLKLSLIGRIAVIKINVLPRLMFLFQALPIIHKMSILDRWQRTISGFVWAGKKPCIKMKALCDLKERGVYSYKFENLF